MAQRLEQVQQETVEVVRSPSLPEICVEVAVCMLERTFVYALEILCALRLFLAQALAETPDLTCCLESPIEGASPLSSPLWGLVDLLSSFCAPAIHSYPSLCVCSKCLAYVCRVNEVGIY